MLSLKIKSSFARLYKTLFIDNDGSFSFLKSTIIAITAYYFAILNQPLFWAVLELAIVFGSLFLLFKVISSIFLN